MMQLPKTSCKCRWVKASEFANLVLDSILTLRYFFECPLLKVKLNVFCAVISLKLEAQKTISRILSATDVACNVSSGNLKV